MHAAISLWAALLAVAGGFYTAKLPCGTIGCSAELDYRPDTATGTLWLRLRVTVPQGDKAPGWLGIGFSPNGAMANGDYIMGYEGCVRALSTGAIDGMPPGRAEPFEIKNASFILEGRSMTLEAIRPLKSNIAGHVHIDSERTNVLYAAGSSRVVPRGRCGRWPLTLLNHHDLGEQGLANHIELNLLGESRPELPLTTTGIAYFGCCAYMKWDVRGDNVSLRVATTVQEGSNPGWLGVGFSPSGTMAAGDYIVAHHDCVRTFSSTKEGQAPGGRGNPEPFQVTDAMFTVAGQVMFLEVTRPLKSSVPGHVNLGTEPAHVLFAGGSGLAAPPSCGNGLSLLNHHNLGYLVGTVKVPIGGGAPAPSPSPGPQWICTVCQHVYEADADGNGAAFEELPSSWRCPVCGQPKSAYVRNNVAALVEQMLLV